MGLEQPALMNASPQSAPTRHTAGRPALFAHSTLCAPLSASAHRFYRRPPAIAMLPFLLLSPQPTRPLSTGCVSGSGSSKLSYKLDPHFSPSRNG